MIEQSGNLLQGVLIVVGALLPIVNPLGNAPFFLALTAGETDRSRNVLARKVAVNGLFLLLAALFLGDDVLKFFGVSVPIVQMAGGLVVAGLAWKLLNRGDDTDKAPPPPPANAGASEGRAFYPLTLPLTVGPGSISVAIALGANFPSTVLPFLADAASAVAGALIVCIVTYVCYRYAEATARLLGTSGTAVVLRLSAFIMLCIGLQIMWNGADALFGVSRTR
jgi:multiple antibiotic resistance protein